MNRQHCTDMNFSDHLSNVREDDNKTWVTTTGAGTLTIICNGVRVLQYLHKEAEDNYCLGKVKDKAAHTYKKKI